MRNNVIGPRPQTTSWPASVANPQPIGIGQFCAAALEHAFNEEKTPSADAWRRVKPFKDVSAARIRYLTVAEAKRLINASQGTFRHLVQAALQTGARYSELARFKAAT